MLLVVLLVLVVTGVVLAPSAGPFKAARPGIFPAGPARWSALSSRLAGSVQNLTAAYRGNQGMAATDSFSTRRQCIRASVSCGEGMAAGVRGRARWERSLCSIIETSLQAAQYPIS